MLNLKDKENIFNELCKLMEEEIKKYEKSLIDLKQRVIEAPGRMESRYDSSKEELSSLYSATEFRKTQKIVFLETLKTEKGTLISQKDKITDGALFCLSDGKIYYILYADAANIIKYKGQEVLIITPKSPLFIKNETLTEGEKLKLMNGEKIEIVYII